MPAATVIPLRAAVPSPIVTVPVSTPGGAVSLDWDQIRGVYLAVCHRCADNLTTGRLAHAHQWAEDHRCDPELAALLSAITSGSAA